MKYAFYQYNVAEMLLHPLDDADTVFCRSLHSSLLEIDMLISTVGLSPMYKLAAMEESAALAVMGRLIDRMLYDDTHNVVSQLYQYYFARQLVFGTMTKIQYASATEKQFYTVRSNRYFEKIQELHTAHEQLVIELDFDEPKALLKDASFIRDMLYKYSSNLKDCIKGYDTTKTLELFTDLYAIAQRLITIREEIAFVISDQ